MKLWSSKRKKSQRRAMLQVLVLEVASRLSNLQSKKERIILGTFQVLKKISQSKKQSRKKKNPKSFPNLLKNQKNPLNHQHFLTNLQVTMISLEKEMLSRLSQKEHKSINDKIETEIEIEIESSKIENHENEGKITMSKMMELDSKEMTRSDLMLRIVQLRLLHQWKNLKHKHLHHLEVQNSLQTQRVIRKQWRWFKTKKLQIKLRRKSLKRN